jgi:ABC-2 type transport system ATP-binding protein
VRLQFAPELEDGQRPAPTAADLEHFGEATVNGPVAELKVDRTRIPDMLATLLDRYTIIDMSVQDPPLDQVIARVFEEAKELEKEEEAVHVAS